ncbi:MAG: tetratricopeptide repeat protein [Carboxylicivirga sp.]|jgi:tetratricopeptide (TPR) repeat protein|nr:tetratricopeptide repeat protein [Carboxylicivirga sp.]
MKRFPLILFFFLTLNHFTTHAQLVNSRKRADSLKQRYENINELNDKEKASLYFSLALTYGNLNLDTAFVFADEGIAYAQENKNTFLTGRMFLAKASLYNYQGQLDQAVKTYNRAIETCLSANDSIAAASALNDKGTCLQKLNRFEEAKQAYKEAGQAFMALKYEHMAGNTHSARALLQYQSGEYIEAVKSANNAIQIFQKHNYPGFMSSPLNVLGNIAMKKKDYNTALEYYHKSQEIEEKENGYEMLIVLQIKYGEIASQKGDYDKAGEELEKGIELCNQYGSSQFKSQLLLALAKNKRQQGYKKEAKDYLLRAENIMLKDGHGKDLAELYLEYSSYHQLMGNNQIAIDYAKRSIAQAITVPFYDYSLTYQKLESLYSEENMNFKKHFPDAKTYIDSVNQHLAVLENIPFGTNVTDSNTTASTARVKGSPQKRDSSYLLWLITFSILIGSLLLLLFLRRRKKQVQLQQSEIKTPTEILDLDGLQMTVVINKRPSLSPQLQSFDQQINQDILLKNHLYRDVKLSQASAISELSKGLYNVRQIRDKFKLINYESFNDYKYKLRVIDYINDLISSIQNPEMPQPDSNDYGLDSDRQLSTVFNAITGIKLTTYKKLLKHSSDIIRTNADKLADLKQKHSNLQLHTNIIRLNIIHKMGITDYQDIDEQFSRINHKIKTYNLDASAIDYLQDLNKKGVNEDDLLSLYMSALFFWINEKEKFPFEFIENLSSLFWGINLEEGTFEHFKAKIHKLRLEPIA